MFARRGCAMVPFILMMSQLRNQNTAKRNVFLFCFPRLLFREKCSCNNIIILRYFISVQLIMLLYVIHYITLSHFLRPQSLMNHS